MKVLQICPLWHPVAADAPGGIETFLSHLVPALQRRGCEISLVASGDSDVPCEIIPAIPIHLVQRMNQGDAWDYRYYEQHQLALTHRIGVEFDIVHSHIGVGGCALSSLPGFGARVVHTIHSPVTPDLAWLVEHQPHLRLTTVSEFQARKLRQRGATRCQAIPNGIHSAAFELCPVGDNGLLFMGRIEPCKGPDIAIQAALALDLPLILAGPIVDQAFYEESIQPRLGDAITYVGVVDHRAKVEMLGSAACVVLPFRGEEPFGLVMIEAMACGTPVVALPNGAAPEIVEPGVTGYLPRDEDAVPDAIAAATKLDRRAIRRRVVARFDIEAVADRYVHLYESIVAEHRFGVGSAA